MELEKVVRQQLTAANAGRPNGGTPSNGQPNNSPNNGHPSNGQSTEAQFHQTVQLLFDQCNLVLQDASSKLRQLNAVLTIYVLVMVNMRLSKRIKPNLLADEGRIQRLNQNLMGLIDHYANGDANEDANLVKLSLKLYLCVVCNNEELAENEFVDQLICDRLFDQLLFKLICNSKKQPSHLALTLLTLIQNKSHNGNPSLFTVRLASLEQEIALNAYGQAISKQLLAFNQEYRKQEAAQNENGTIGLSIFSALSGLMLAANNPPKTEPTPFEQALNSADYRCTLLALHDILQLNRNFTPFLLTNHSNQGDDKETDNLLINLLEFTSINILSLREHFKNETLQKKLTATLRLCFVILTSIVEDQFSNSTMHDSTSRFKVQIHRSKMPHRLMADANVKCNRPIAYSILDLMVEFLCSNLRKKHFEIDLYVFCNNIILKILCHQIKFEIRKEFNWSELIQSLFILLKYLTTNYERAEELQVKRRSKMLLLANNVVNLFNLFIIFGDTFLYSPTSYDDVYYELLRENAIFVNLSQLAKQAALSKKKDEKEAASKLLNSLENVEAIIAHFTSKINESKSEPPLSEAEIREIVRNNYETLSIRVKDNLDIYDSSQPDKHFKRKVLKRIIEQTKSHLVNLEELVNDQQTVLQSILNC